LISGLNQTIFSDYFYGQASFSDLINRV